MLDKNVLSIHFDCEPSALSSPESIAGGDSSSALTVELYGASYFVKYNEHSCAKNMFTSEVEGLVALAEAGIPTPSDIRLSHDPRPLLSMAFIPNQHPTAKHMEGLGETLAKLHATTHTSFGWGSDNYIGPLELKNSWSDNWVHFYVHNRLIPQFTMAKERNWISEIPSIQQLISLGEKLGNPTAPALLHGDLWSGNYLTAHQSSVYLIDPAVCYGDPAMDIAMTLLFGGFDDHFYNTYYQASNSQMPTEGTIAWYQLYYLLVNANINGPSYISGVLRLLRRLL